jgi:hypothetical protein
MNQRVVCAAASLAAILAFAGSASAEVRVTYPQVRVELGATHTPDAAFEKFRKQFMSAVDSKDLNALSALVAPGFVWLTNSALASDYDPGRDAQHTFRVVFGFRAVGNSADGDVEGGPFWSILKGFADDDSFNQISDSGNLVCSPNTASAVNTEVYERAAGRVEEAFEGAQWVFLLRTTSVTKAPDDTGTPIGKIGIEAVPVISSYPEKADVATHFEILLPSGRRGWIPANAARPMQGDRLCYVLTPSGDWKIGIYDAAETDAQ